MMSFLGNKKYIKIFSFVIAAVFIISVGAIAVTSMGNTAMASPKSDIGIVAVSYTHLTLPTNREV